MRVLVLATLAGLIAFTFTSKAQQPRSPASQPLAKLKIEVVDVRTRKGELILGVFKTAEGFPGKEKNSVIWQVVAADTKAVTFECELPPGRYGASVLHDENSNKDMDTNMLGIPTEGYGVTNNPKPKFRAATFKESQFDLPAEGATMKISVQYF